MKPRLALIAVLALGVLVCGSTATPAFAASAGSAQYAPEEEESHFCEESGGVETANGCVHEEERPPEPAPAPEPEPTCEENESGSGSNSSSSESGSDERCKHAAPTHLPYTGFPVAPALLVGVGLLGSGILLRRRLHSGGGFA